MLLKEISISVKKLGKNNRGTKTQRRCLFVCLFKYLLAYSGKQETKKSVGKLGFCRVNCNFVSKEQSIFKVIMKFFEGGKIITLYRVKNYKIIFRRFQTPN